VDVPKSKNHSHHNGTEAKTADNTPGHGNGVGPDATGPAAFGLCQAFESGPSTTNPNDGKSHSVAMQNLAKAAAANNGESIAAYCKAVDAAKATKTTDGSEAPEVTEAPEPTDVPEAPETSDTKPANPGQSNAVHGNSTSQGHTPTTGGSGHPSGPQTPAH
jgi:hypothetical protein